MGRPVGGCAALIALAIGVATAACEPWPRDPRGTFAAAAGATLRVGVTEAPPWVTRAGERATGPEPELLEAFARSIDARVEWVWGPTDDHLRALERYELHAVAAGLTAESPWGRRVALTRPWRVAGDDRRVLAVPPGENRTLVALERLIESRARVDSR